MNLLALIGMAMSAGLIVAASILKDGMALIAIILLSVTSSIVGLANYWTVDLQKRTHSREVPDGDVVVIGRQGAFLIVRCDEKVARELYFGQEQCKYKFGDSSFRFFAGTGTFLFMAAVVFLASGTWAMQAAIGLSYICLNGAYWLVAALIPGKYQWDLRAYEIRDDMEQKMVVKGNFTAAIWHAIHETKSARWVRTAKLIPDTDAWKQWLDEAQVHAEVDKDKLEWDAQKRLTEIIKDHMKNQPKGLQPAQTV